MNSRILTPQAWRSYLSREYHVLVACGVPALKARAMAFKQASNVLACDTRDQRKEQEDK